MKTEQIKHSSTPIFQTVLDNKLTVLTAQTKSKLVSITVYVKAGYIYATNLADVECPHFIEHLKAGDGSHADAYQRITNNGINSDAYTDPEGSWYEVNGLASDATELIKAQLTIAFTPLEKLLHNQERERSAMLVEHSQRERETNFRQPIMQALYPTIHCFSHTGTELKQAVKNCTTDQLQTWHQRWYHPHNTAIVIAGPQTHEEVLQIVDSVQIQNTDGDIPIFPDDIDPIPTEVTLESTHLSHDSIAVYFPGPKNSTSAAINEVIDQLMISYDHGALYKKLRKEQHLAYSCGSRTMPDPASATGWDSRIDRDHFSKFITAVHDGLKAIIDHDINLNTFQSIKNKMLINCLRSEETIHNDGWTSRLIDTWHGYPPIDKTKIIQELTIQQVADYCKSNFSPNQIAVVKSLTK